MIENHLKSNKSGTFVQTDQETFHYWLLPLWVLHLLCVCTPEATNYCFHGNWPKCADSEIVKKIVHLCHPDMFWVGWQNLNPSRPNWASKSAFPNFHGNGPEFWNSDFRILLFDSYRFCVPNFITIGWDMAEKLSDEKGSFRWKMYLFSKCPRLPGSLLKMCVLCVWLYPFLGEPFAQYFLISQWQPKTDFLSSCRTMTTAPMPNPAALGPFS